MDTLWPNIRDAFAWIGEKAGEVFGDIKKFWEDTLSPALTDLKDYVVDTLWPNIRDAFVWIGEKAGEVFGDIKKFWEDTLSPVLTDLKDYVMDTLWPNIRDAFGWIGEKAGEVFENIKKFWEDTLSPVLTDLKDYVMDTLWPNIRDAFAWIGEKAGEVFGDIKKFWEDTLSPTLTAFKDFALNTLWPKISNVFDWIKTAWQALGKKFENIKETYIDPVYEFMSGTFGPIFETIAGFWDNTFGKAFENLGITLNNVKNGGLTTLVNWINGTFATAFNTIEGVINNVIGAVQTVIGWFETGMSKLNEFRQNYDNNKRYVNETLNAPAAFDSQGRPLVYGMQANGGFMREGQSIIAEAGPELLSIKNGRAMVEPLSTGTGSDVAARLEMLADIVAQYLPDIAGNMDRPVTIDGRSFGRYATKTVDSNVTQRQTSQRIARGG